MNQQLINALQGCLNHNTVHASQHKLAQLSQQSDFTQQLLRLIPQVQQHEMLILLLTTLKNFFTAQYASSISQGQKSIFRNSAIDLFYQIKHNPNAIKIYKEIIYFVVTADFCVWPSLPEQILNDLNGRIEAGVYFSRQVAKVYQYIEENKREQFQQFVILVFPKLQQIVEQILSNFNETTCLLLDQIFKCFYSAFHVAPPKYIRDFSAFERWMVFFQCIFQAPTSPLTAKSQSITAHIYEKIFSRYCNDNQDGNEFKGWANQFRNRYAFKLYQLVYKLVINKAGGNEEIYSTLLNCLTTVISLHALRQMVTSQQIQHLFYKGTILPLCQSTKEQLDMFQKDGIEYVRRQEDLSCFAVRRAVMDLVQAAVNSLVFNGKSQLMRMVEFCAGVLSNNNGNDGDKEVAVRVLSAIGKVLLKQKYFKKEFQNLVVTYFQPLLTNNNKLLNSLTLSLLSEYLPFGDLSPQAVGSLMERIYAKIIQSGSDNLLVVRYNAILAFTSLLGHKAALQSAKPHFQAILEIYVKTLNEFDHENLLECLESIVKHFDSQIISFAPDLLNHLLKMFCSLAKTQNDEEDDEDEPDCNTPASAALSTVKQILNCNLPDELYLNVSADLIDLFRGIFGQYSNYFDEVLSLFAVLCHRAKAIADFEYPYAVCRWLLEGNQLNLSGSKLSNELLNQISKIVKADSEFQDNIIAILKNIIQKAPDQILRSYPWPKHQQLILALIENRRISAEQLGSLDTSDVNPLWSAYLSAYSLVVFNIGSLANPRDIHEIVGVSLYPWLKEGVCPEMVKIIAGSVDEDDEDDLLQENTAQMLQKYALEDDQDQEDYNEQTTGTNYTYLYDSPFDVAKDRDMLIMQVKSLSNEAAIALANGLNHRYRQKLEILMNGSN